MHYGAVHQELFLHVYGVRVKYLVLALDNWGFRLAISILKASKEPGKNDPTHTQYDSIRKIVSSYSNHFEASRLGADETWVLKTDYKNSFFTICQTRSEFFVRFKEGLKNRMGREVKGDLALDYKILHKILFHLKQEMLDTNTTFERRHEIAMFGSFYTISFVLAFRGNETLMLDLRGLINHLNEGLKDQQPHIVIPLLGRFKGEDYTRYHLILAPNRTDSGFEPRLWLEWLTHSKKAQQIFDGPAFSDSQGFVLAQQSFNIELREQLEWTKEAHPSLFSEDVDLDRIKTSQSFRKGSTSRAQDLNIDQNVIDANNCWRTFDKAKGSRPQLNLRDHYSAVRLMTNKLLKYPQAIRPNKKTFGIVRPLPRWFV